VLFDETYATQFLVLLPKEKLLSFFVRVKEAIKLPKGKYH